MPKCDFNKVALQLYRNRTLAWLFSCKSAAYPFPKNTSERLLLHYQDYKIEVQMIAIKCEILV